MKGKIPSFHFPLAEELPREGKLSRTPAYAILLWAAQHSFSGRLIFERQARMKHVHVEAGTITQILSNLVPEGLDMILGRGFLPKSRVNEITQIELESNSVEKNEIRLLEFLRSKKWLSESQISEVLDYQLEDRLLNLLGWFDGKYRVEGAQSTAQTPDRSPSSLRLSTLFAQVEQSLFFQNNSFRLGGTFAPPLKGDLRSVGGAALLMSLLYYKASGQVLLERGERKKLIKFDDGTVGSVASTDPGETLGVVLERWNYLSSDLVSRLESMIRARGGRLRDLVAKEKLLEASEIAEALAVLQSERILEAFSWRSGSYEFTGQISEPGRFSLSFSLLTADEITESEAEAPENEATPASLPDASESLSTFATFDRALHNLFQTTGEPSVALIPLPEQPRLIPNLLELASRWREADLKTVVILVTKSPKEEGTTIDVTGSNFLRLPASEIGTETRTKLQDHFQRIFWVFPADESEKLRKTTIPAALVVTKNRSAMSDLRNFVTSNGDMRIEGFLYAAS